MSDDTHIGFYGEFPASWGLTPEQEEGWKAMERAMGACVDGECVRHVTEEEGR